MVWNGSSYVSPTQRKQTSPFVKGPIPLSWLRTASSLPGKALNIGNVLWFLHGITKKKAVKLTNRELSKWGISRHQKDTALCNLEGAGLIHVQRNVGKNPVVTILEAPPGDI
jgi:hypothetical protein